MTDNEQPKIEVGNLQPVIKVTEDAAELFRMWSELLERETRRWLKEFFGKEATDD